MSLLQKGHFHHGDTENTEIERVLAHMSRALSFFLFSVNSVSQW
jgi:hypothetical protein